MRLADNRALPVVQELVYRVNRYVALNSVR
jgi:hypothetical protein